MSRGIQSYRRLTELERRLALKLINSKCHPEDKQPEEVIRTTYDGNTDAYIWEMLRFEGLLGRRS